MDIKYLKIREILSVALGGKDEASPTRKAVAEDLQISQAYISQILTGKRKGSLEILIDMARIAGLEHLIDEGLKIEINDCATSTQDFNTLAFADSSPQQANELLLKAKAVLESDSHWSESLSTNIESFYKGIQDRRKCDQPDKIPLTGDRRKRLVG